MILRNLVDNLLTPRLTALDFIDRYAGIVKTLSLNQVENGQVKKYPIACNVTNADCENTGVYTDLVPNDDKLSVVYWEEITPMRNVGQTKQNNFFNKKFQGVARLIFWANLPKMGIDTCNGAFGFYPILIKAITQKGQMSLGNGMANYWIEPLADVEQDYRKIFAKYSYPELKNYSMFPYDVFAIDVSFTLEYCLDAGGVSPLAPSIDCVNIPVSPCEQLPTTCPEILDFIQPVRTTCIIPSLNFATGFDDDFNALNVTQKNDLSSRICIPCPQPTRKSTVLDGANESIFAPYNIAHELERTDSFTIDIFVKISAYKLGAIIGKFDYQGIRRGYVLWTLADGRWVFELASNESTGNTVTTITVNPVGSGAWKRLTVVYTGTSTAAGVTMYIDKTSVPYSVFQDNLTTGTTVDNSNVLRIGGNDPGAFAGKVYAAKIWKNRALTPLEVAALPIETDTPIYQANLICWQDCGTGALVGSTVAVYPDRTGITTGYQSVNTEASDFDTDVPT